MTPSLAKLREALLEADDGRAVLTLVADKLIQTVFPDRVIICDRRVDEGVPLQLTELEQVSASKPIMRLDRRRMAFDSQIFSTPIIISNTATSRLYQTLEYTLRDRSIRSFAAIPIYDGEEVSGFIELHFCQLYQRWQRSDLGFFDHVADLCGWALDRMTSSSGEREERKPEAVGEISSVVGDFSSRISIHHDPELIGLRALQYLISRTRSQAGAVLLRNTELQRYEITAAHGLSEQGVAEFEEVFLTQHVVSEILSVESNAQPSIIEPDARICSLLTAPAKKSLVIALTYQERLLGMIQLFRNEAGPWTNDDLDAVTTVTRYTGQILYQAGELRSERRNADALRALYELTHELTKHFSAREVAEHAFPIIQEQVPCQRMWLATFNESGTHLVGQAGFGPRLRKRIVQLRIQRAQPHPFLDRAIEERRPVIVPEGADLGCPELMFILKRLNLRTMVILPLVALGQVIGVLIVEPSNQHTAEQRHVLDLLARMAAEIGTVLLARRFESKMATEDKMRTMGLLASGVAHNFNNILQAIMGQASLIEIQLGENSPLTRSARLITDSAHRGAGLIKQLVACTVGETQNVERIRVKTMIEESKDFYRSIVGSAVDLTIEGDPELPDVLVDYGRIQQTIASLLVHAKESIVGNPEGKVVILFRRRAIRASEDIPELLPGTYLAISVSHNGAVLTPEHQAQLFEPFYNLFHEDAKAQSSSPTQFNLSASYTYIKNYSGTITVQSNKSEGTTITLLLPEAAAERRGREAQELQANALAREQVILFDVDEGVARPVSAVLESWGYAVVAHQKRQRLKDALEASAIHPRLVLIDPDRSSEDLVGFLREIRRTAPESHFVIASFDVRRWTRLLKDVDRITMINKPLSIWALERSLARLLGIRSDARLDEVVERFVEPSQVTRSDRREGLKKKQSVERRDEEI